MSLVHNVDSDKSPRDVKIMNSLVKLSNKVTELEAIAYKLDRAIHRYN